MVRDEFWQFSPLIHPFNLMFLLRVSQSLSNGCFFFCPLILFWLACVTEAGLSENKKRFGVVHENGNTHMQRINNFSKFLDKRLSLCSTEFLFLPFIHEPQTEIILSGVHCLDLLDLISFEGSISLAPFSGALFFSFLFLSFCFFHVSALRGGCSSHAQLHPANYYYTQTLLPVLWFDAKASTMVDKIPWDTCVIALIFGVFKTEFKKKHCYPF